MTAYSPEGNPMLSRYRVDRWFCQAVAHEVPDMTREETKELLRGYRAMQDALGELLEVAQVIDTCVPYLPPSGQTNIAKAIDRLSEISVRMARGGRDDR